MQKWEETVKSNILVNYIDIRSQGGPQSVNDTKIRGFKDHQQRSLRVIRTYDGSQSSFVTCLWDVKGRIKWGLNRVLNNHGTSHPIHEIVTWGLFWGGKQGIMEPVRTEIKKRVQLGWRTKYGSVFSGRPRRRKDECNYRRYVTQDRDTSIETYEICVTEWSKSVLRTPYIMTETIHPLLSIHRTDTSMSDIHRLHLEPKIR